MNRRVGILFVGLILGGIFVVLDANPLDDIANSGRINKVYLRGQEVNRAQLKANWAREGASQ